MIIDDITTGIIYYFNVVDLFTRTILFIEPRIQSVVDFGAIGSAEIRRTSCGTIIYQSKP